MPRCATVLEDRHLPDVASLPSGSAGFRPRLDSVGWGRTDSVLPRDGAERLIVGFSAARIDLYHLELG